MTTPLPPFRKFKSKQFIEYSKVSSFIYQKNESSILETPAKKVNPKIITTPEFQKKIKYIKDCLKKYRKITGVGRGIAAPQIGYSEKFAVIYTPQELILIINPIITKISENKYLYPEMCMSAVPVIAKVIRPAWVEFKYLDEKGQPKFWTTKDNTKQGKILNRVFQHEIDHLEGIINIKKIDSLEDLLFYSNPTFYDKAKFIKI